MCKMETYKVQIVITENGTNKIRRVITQNMLLKDIKNMGEVIFDFKKRYRNSYVLIKVY